MYLIEIPHQTTTIGQGYKLSSSCILSKFHIKPQLITVFFVVADSCILSKFHIKPQLSPKGPTSCFVVSYRNSTSNHNNNRPIFLTTVLYLIEIPHQTTTFSINDLCMRGCILSKFHIKPQLRQARTAKGCGCILSKFHIKPQRKTVEQMNVICCILSKFHIKPQQNRSEKNAFGVVSYRNSTSNHNYEPFRCSP